MRLNYLHSPLGPKDFGTAARIQHDLRDRILSRPPRPHLPISLVAGCDVAASARSDVAHAAVVVLTFPGLEPFEEATASGRVAMPYVPGFLAFREAPVLAAALERLRCEPDLFLFDGQGVAHPRGMGLASYMGLMVDRPSIGVAKSRLYGSFSPPGVNRGDSSPLLDDGGREIGRVLRSRHGVRPLFISVGHLLSLDDAVRFTLVCGKGLRLPEPTRLADILVGRLGRTWTIR
ncbi:MAG: endonuclease V [Pseudomonadota bacterium]